MKTQGEKHLMHDGLHVVGDDSNDSQQTPHGSRTVHARNETVLLKCLNDHGVTPLSKLIGHDHSYLSRWRDGEQGIRFKELLAVLDACGLKLVEASTEVCLIDPKQREALITLADIGMAHLKREVTK